eukprot:scaffold19843_cov75-Phaeocystis_antarctica.AAC.1
MRRPHAAACRLRQVCLPCRDSLSAPWLSEKRRRCKVDVALAGAPAMPRKRELLRAWGTSALTGVRVAFAQVWNFDPDIPLASRQN